MADWLSLTTEEFAADRIAVLPVAAVEQHGPHLPVGVDTYIARSVSGARARVAAGGSPVRIPPGAGGRRVGRAQGVSRHADALAGNHAARLHRDRRERARAGIAKLVIVNSHGGNIALIDLAARQLRVRANMLAVHCSWGRFGYPDGLFSR